MTQENLVENAGKEDIKFPVKKFILSSLLFSGILLLTLSALFFVVYQSLKQNIFHTIDEAQFEELEHIEHEIQENLSRVDLTLYNLSRMNASYSLLQNKDSRSKTELHSLMANTILYQKNYDQLRILDLSGKEVSRVNMSKSGKPRIVPPSQLQNKKERYYFKEALALQQDQIYMSPFDLNMEKGKIERPFKPMIRMARIIPDARGNTRGVAIINFLGQSLFDTIDKHNIHAGDQWYLLNSEGYYLKGPRQDLDFAFMFPEKKDIGLFSQNPEFWQEIQSNRISKWINKDGHYYYKTMVPLSNSVRTGKPVEWTLIMLVPQENIGKSLKILYRGLRLGAYILYPLILILSVALAYSRSRNGFLIDELKTQADHDELSGLFNRRAIIEKLEYLINLVKRNNSELSVVFADINDLKMMNDLQGHDAGDQMILAASKAFQDEIRATDIAARIGGDEFLIVFPGCGPGQTELIMERVLYNFESSGVTRSGKSYKMAWGSSHWMGETDSLDGLINRADEKMYSMKKKMKGGNSSRDDVAIDHVPFPD
jgi:diguanylate cyclase (GGDEF)-like protein